MSRIELVKCLLQDALRLPPGIDRPAWLAIRCQEDRDVEQEVLSLLSAHAEMERAGVPASAPEPGLPMARFGAYRAVELLGRGGMSSVFRAERADGQFDQTVALKIMAGYLAGHEFLKRFENERQVLAALTHNHITRLLDGGISSAGDPYLITEYVEGQTVDRYCDEHKLDVEARLRLFLQVCDAVDYAHRNLIVHRDLKPGNILVDTQGSAKLLDFGTASLLASEGDVTVTRAHLLTPRYASPEQLRGKRVNTSTDVFSLGVILYELLTGAWPFGDPDSVLSELNRATGDTVAKPPSTVISDEAALSRSASRQQLSRMLKKDLAPIVLKALENDPSRRYGSVRQFADDIERFLDGRPILARPQTALYRAGKFVRRRWLPVTAAAIFALGLSAATIVAVYQFRSARRHADRAERINAFLNSMLGSPNPSWYNTLHNKGKNVTVIDVLDELRGRIGKELADQPEVEIGLRRTVGRMYYTLGQHKEAREQLELALQRQLLATGRNHPDTGILYKDLAYEEYLTRRNPEAWSHAREALAILKRAGRQQDRQEIIESLDILAIALYASGRPLAEAEEPLREALARSRESFGEGGDTPALIGTLSTFALLQGKFDDAVQLAKKSLALYRARPGPMTVECFTPLRNLGAVCLERLDYKCAENYFRAGLETTEKNLGADSLFNMNLRAYYALAIGLSGQGTEAERMLNDYVQRTRTAGGSTELYVAMAKEFLGRVQMAEGKLDVAEANLREALDTYRQYRSTDDIRNTVVAGRLGECLLQRKQRLEALPLLTASYQSLLGALGPNHQWTMQARDRLARAQ